MELLQKATRYIDIARLLFTASVTTVVDSLSISSSVLSLLLSADPARTFVYLPTALAVLCSPVQYRSRKCYSNPYGMRDLADILHPCRICVFDAAPKMQFFFFGLAYDAMLDLQHASPSFATENMSGWRRAKHLQLLSFSSQVIPNPWRTVAVLEASYPFSTS